MVLEWTLARSAFYWLMHKPLCDLYRKQFTRNPLMVLILKDLWYLSDWNKNHCPSRTLIMCFTQAFCPKPTQEVPLRFQLVQGTHLEPANWAKMITSGNRAFCKIILTVWWMNSHHRGFQNIWVHFWTFGGIHAFRNLWRSTFLLFHMAGRCIKWKKPRIHSKSIQSEGWNDLLSLPGSPWSLSSDSVGTAKNPFTLLQKCEGLNETIGLPCRSPFVHTTIAVFTEATWWFSAGTFINQRAARRWLCSLSLGSGPK